MDGYEVLMLRVNPLTGFGSPRRGAGGGGFTDPTDDASATHWWVGSAGVSTTGTVVDSWTDQISSVAFSTGTKPEYVASDINSQEVIDFQLNDFLVTSASVSPGDSHAVICCVYIPGTQTYSATFVSLFSFDGADDDFQFQCNSTTTDFWGEINSSGMGASTTKFSASAGTQIGDGDWHIIAVVWDSSAPSVSTYLDDFSSTWRTSSDYTSPMGTNLAFQWAANRNTSYKMQHKVSDIIITTDISASNLANYQGYFETKLGATFPITP